EFYALLNGLVIDDAKIFNNKLREWEDYYNYHRPHGGLGGQTPYERLRQITQTPAVTDERQSHTAGGTAFNCGDVEICLLRAPILPQPNVSHCTSPSQNVTGVCGLAHRCCPC